MYFSSSRFLHMSLSRQSHPQPDKFKTNENLSSAKNDKNKKKHNDRFVKVSAAYDVLSDEKKRSTYDKYGQNGLDALEKGVDPEEAGFGGFGGGGGGASFNNAEAFKMFENMVSDLHIPLHILNLRGISFTHIIFLVIDNSLVDQEWEEAVCQTWEALEISLETWVVSEAEVEAAVDNKDDSNSSAKNHPY